MNPIRRNALIALSIFTGLMLFAETGSPVSGQSSSADKTSSSDKKGNYVTSEAKEVKDAQDAKKKTDEQVAAALPNLRAAENKIKAAQKSEIENLNASPRDREARKQERALLDDELLAAKRATSKATVANSIATKHLRDVEARYPEAAAQQQTTDQPRGKRTTDQPQSSEPATGRQPRQPQKQFRNVMGDLQSHLKETYHWVERVNIAAQGATGSGPLPQEQWIPPDPKHLRGTIDPYDRLIRNIQVEQDSGPKKGYGRPRFQPRLPSELIASEVKQNPPATQPTKPTQPTQPKPAGAGNPALEAAIAKQREKVQQIKGWLADQDTDVGRAQTEKQLREAERELKRLEDQLRSGR